MTSTLPNGTRIRVTYSRSSFHRREGVIVGQVGNLYRVQIGTGGTFLRRDELVVLPPVDDVNDRP
jgi:hypothetical protein